MNTIEQEEGQLDVSPFQQRAIYNIEEEASPTSVSRQLQNSVGGVVKETRQYLKYTFFKIQPEWRRLPKIESKKGRDEFLNVLRDFENRMIMKFYSLIGIRGDCDFMIWSLTENLDDLQELVGRILSTKLGGYLTIPYSYLAMSRPSEYLGQHKHQGQEGLQTKKKPANTKYLFVYPFTKKREWYNIPYEERRRIMGEHFRVGHKYPTVKINTGYSFGLDDQEFMLAFETDYPADFLELVMELRSSEASKYTALETPIFTCISVEPEKLIEVNSG
jgi:chlorite dismutase